MKHHHSILPYEPGQVLIEAAISKGRMWVVVLDRDTFLLKKGFQKYFTHVTMDTLGTFFQTK